MKKRAVSSTGRSEDLTDSYTSGGDLNRIEQGVFRFLKTLVCEFEDIFRGLPGNDQSKVLPDLCVRLPVTLPKLPETEHTVVMIVPAGKSEEETDDTGAETQMKLIISHNAGMPNPEIFVSSGFPGKAVNGAGRFAVVFTEKEAVEGDNEKKSGADIETNQSFVFPFSYTGQGSDREAAMVATSETARAESGELISRSHSDVSAEKSEQTIVCNTLGKTLGTQAMDILALGDTEDSDIFKKPFTFVSGMQSGGISIDSVGTDGAKDVHLADAVTQNRVSEYASGPHTTDVQPGNNGAIPVFVISAKDVNQSVGINGEKEGGTTLYAGYGQGELKSSPMAGSPLFFSGNEMIISKTEAFVNRLNALLGENADAGGAIDGEKIDTKVFPEMSQDGLRLLQTGHPEIRFVVRNAAKKIFGDFGELPGVELIGFSLGGDGMIRLDTSVLASQLASGGEETAGAAESFSNALFDRINYLMNPCAGMYADDKNMLSMRTVRKDEGALFQDREMKEERGSLEKRLNELKLLIERSRSLTEWLARDDIISSDQPEGTNGSP